MTANTPYRIKTISEYHKLLGCAKPQHPLISLIRQEDFTPMVTNQEVNVVFDFYLIALKRNTGGSMHYGYGQGSYDFEEGIMFFLAPGQVFSFTADENTSVNGWMLLIHPDFLWNTPLAGTIKQYEYFSYFVNEALCLSEKEENIIGGVVDNIEREYHSNTDKFSETIIITQVETLLAYADRFYNRQFLTRKKVNHQVLSRMESLLDRYFNDGKLLAAGSPTVQYIAAQLNVSPNYLSGLLKVLTGKSTQEHIHDKIITVAKLKLSTTDLSVSEIAFSLGFDYPQTFGNLFKKKTNLSPLEFRQSFN